MGSRSLAYVSAVDGLRALAVVAVFVYHFDPNILPGGFLGVDLFFVISGYLITLGLIDQHAVTGRIDLEQFWWRRARRLLPAALTLVLAMLTIALITAPDRLMTLRGEALATIAYVTNWYFVFREQPYFESVGDPSVLRHLWSLAVEEQFYLVWPLVLSVTLPRVPRGWLAFGVLLAAAGSAALAFALDGGGASPDRLYYGTDTRAFALLAGAALAFACRPALGRKAGYTEEAVVNALGITAFILIIDMAFTLDGNPDLLYRGGLAIMAAASAVLIAMCVRMDTPITRVLGSMPFCWLGVRSYSVYLWHWPAILLVPRLMDIPATSLSALLVQAAVTLLAAEISYRFIEMPFRTRTMPELRHALAAWRGQRRAGAAFAMAAAAVALLLLAAGTVTAREPDPPSYLAVSNVSGIFVSEVLVGATPDLSTSARAPYSSAFDRDAPDAALPIVVAPTPTQAPALVAAAGPRQAPATVDVPAAPTEMNGLVGGNTPPGRTDIVTAVGDSVMLGSAYALARTFGIVDIDAAAGRSVGSAIGVLDDRIASGTVGSTVIIQLGNNGAIRAEDLRDLLQLLSPEHYVLLVNLRVPRPWEAPNNAILARIAREFPNARLVDWHEASAGHEDLFYDDRIHLQPEGAAFFANLIAATAATLPQTSRTQPVSALGG